MSVFSPLIFDNLCDLYNLIYAVDFVEYNSGSISVCQESACETVDSRFCIYLNTALFWLITQRVEITTTRWVVTQKSGISSTAWRKPEIAHCTYVVGIPLNNHNHNHLFSVPEIHQSGYRTCQYITTNTVQNESLQYNTYNNNNSL